MALVLLHAAHFHAAHQFNVKVDSEYILFSRFEHDSSQCLPFLFVKVFNVEDVCMLYGRPFVERYLFRLFSL